MKKRKKKTGKILSEIDGNLDTVLNILSKIALIALIIKTIVQILTTL